MSFDHGSPVVADSLTPAGPLSSEVLNSIAAPPLSA